MDDETRQELLDIENALARLQLAEKDLYRQMQVPWEKMRVIEAKTMLEIAAATDGRHKVYPNKQAREAALTVRLHEDSEYQALREKRRELDAEREKITVELARLRQRKEILWLSLRL